MSEFKPTPGPWIVHHDTRWDELSIRSANEELLADAPVYYEIASDIGGRINGENFDDYSEVEANANLIAEAGTVYHETGLTPREILSQRDELLDALQLAAERMAAVLSMHAAR